jgi:NADPH2:quinone reductase
MRAVHIGEYGPSSNFKIVEVDKPAIEAREVLVKVEAAGIIFSDVIERRGGYGPPAQGFPYAIGWEVAGNVEKIGSEVTGFELGQRVGGTLPNGYGGYAEYAAVPAKTLRPIPARVSFEQALVYLINLPVAYVHYATFGNTQPDETILIHAASGGVGSMLTQLAKRKGNRNTVIALASTDEKLEFCRTMGADHLINYRKVDYVEAVKKITDNRGVDVVFNSVGGDTLKTDPKVIKRLTGRWVITGAAAGVGSIDPYAFIYDSITVRPCSVLTLEGTEAQTQSLRLLDDWLKTEPLIQPTRVFKFEDVAAAHDLLDQQRVHGKLVLIP